MDIPIRDIYEADRGFNVAAGIVTQTADGVPLNDIYNELVDALNEWNRGDRRCRPFHVEHVWVSHFLHDGDEIHARDFASQEFYFSRPATYADDSHLRHADKRGLKVRDCLVGVQPRGGDYMLFLRQ